MFERNKFKRNAVKACLPLALVIFVLAALAYSQDTTGALAEKLKSLGSQLRRQRERQSAERRLLDTRKILLLEEIEALKRREKELSARRDALEKESEKLTGNARELTSKAERLRQQRIEAEKLTGEMAAVLVNHIDSGLPLDTVSRKSAVQDLVGSADMPEEEMKVLWQLYVQEYRRASEIELTSPGSRGMEKNGPSPAGAISHTVEIENGARLDGRILRIGAVGALFLSDDGRVGAMLVKTTEGYVWRRVGAYGELSELRNAFEIAAGRRAPQIVTIPLQKMPEGGGK